MEYPALSVVILTVGRRALQRAIRSVYAQDFNGNIQILIGVDVDLYGQMDTLIKEIHTEKPDHISVTVIDPGFSTSCRHGETHSNTPLATITPSAKLLTAYGTNRHNLRTHKEHSLLIKDKIHTKVSALLFGDVSFVNNGFSIIFPKSKRGNTMKCLAVTALSLGILLPITAEATTVNSFYGNYDASKKSMGNVATSLSPPKKERWTFTKAQKPYMLGVLLPHMKDSYWNAAAYGIQSQAKAAGINVRLIEAGGYNNLGIQRLQLKQQSKDEVDGVILASISYDKLDPYVNRIVKSGTPVVELVNDIKAKNIAAKSLVSFFDMGYKAGEFIVKDAKKKKVTVAFLPGPKGSGWAPDTFLGFKAAVAKASQQITVHEPLWGDTGAKAQSSLIKRAFYFHNDVDYLVGNAVMASVAPEILKQEKRSKTTTVVSTYITPEVYDHIQKGDVAAAPSDLTVEQGRIAIDMMARILNGEKPGMDFPFRSGPEIPVITKQNQSTYTSEMLFGPKTFVPTVTSPRTK